MTEQQAPFTFPGAPTAEAVEWPGTPLGLGNCVTRTKSRTAVYDKSLDETPGKREGLLNAVTMHLATARGQAETTAHDVVIHGIRVRCVTNSPHLADFWRDNWYSAGEWETLTGQAAPGHPRVWVYALAGVAGQPEAAYYSRSADTIIFFNTSYYGQLKSWVLGAVGRVLADESGIHSIHGAGVSVNGHGVLYIAPTGTGKSTSSYGLMRLPGSRFHSDDWVYVRYAYRDHAGRSVTPTTVHTPVGPIRGYRVFGWLDAHARAAAPSMRVSGLTLDNLAVELTLGDLALEEGPLAFAYTSEKHFYLRTNLVESFPEASSGLLASKLENVPDVHARPDPPGRLVAFDNARAMLDITRIFGRERTYTNPLEPMRLTTVVLLSRDNTTDTVVESLDWRGFATRLLIGETPDKKREIAYNAYRAVNEQEEKAYVAGLDQRIAGLAGESRLEALAQALVMDPDVPATLREEFSLFSVMHQTCRCYAVNTILQSDPAVGDKREAVSRTIGLFASLIRRAPWPALLTLADYTTLLH